MKNHSDSNKVDLDSSSMLQGIIKPRVRMSKFPQLLTAEKAEEKILSRPENLVYTKIQESKVKCPLKVIRFTKILISHYNLQ